VARALITGGGGQDGHYLVEQLVAEGTDVHVLLHPAEKPPENPSVTTHPGDVADLEGTRSPVLDLAPEQVYNRAAISSVARSWDDPEGVFKVNGEAAVWLMEAAHLSQRQHDRPVRFLQASSAEIFGEPETSPQDEQTPMRPVNPYGTSKAFAHTMVGVYRTRGMHTSAVILYNHESPRRPSHFVTRKITSTVAAIAAGRADELALGNLDARRAWGWAPDYVDAMVRAIRADEAADYVVATGKSHSVREFAAAAFAAAGIDDWTHLVRVDPAFVRPVDPTELVGDASRARTRLDWAPTKDFEQIVAAMVESDLSAEGVQHP
jgi:GDPmannose 4,6-dehydratase